MKDCNLIFVSPKSSQILNAVLFASDPGFVHVFYKLIVFNLSTQMLSTTFYHAAGIIQAW